MSEFSVVFLNGKLDVAATCVTPGTLGSRSINTRDAVATASSFGYLGPRKETSNTRCLSGDEPEIGVPEAGKAAHEPTGARDEDDRERNFHDRHRAQPPGRAAPAAGGTVAFAHEGSHVRARQPQRRREADEQAAHDECRRARTATRDRRTRQRPGAVTSRRPS